MPEDNDPSPTISDFYALQSQLALPYMPTPQCIIDHVIIFLENRFYRTTRQVQHAVDLGSGDGRVVRALAEAFPSWKIRGIEINRELYEAGLQKIKGIPNARIMRGDLFQEDLTGVDIVFLFALPTIMPSMGHIFKHLNNTTLIISFRYPLQIPEFYMQEIFHETLKVGEYLYQFFVYQPVERQ